MLDFNQTFFIQIINFLLIIFAVNFLLVQPILKILRLREQRINTQTEQINDLKAKAEENVQKYEDALTLARREAVTERTLMREEALKNEQALLELTGKNAHAEISQAKDQISSEIRATKEKIMTQVDNFAQKAANKLLGQA